MGLCTSFLDRAPLTSFLLFATVQKHWVRDRSAPQRSLARRLQGTVQFLRMPITFSPPVSNPQATRGTMRNGSLIVFVREKVKLNPRAIWVATGRCQRPEGEWH